MFDFEKLEAYRKAKAFNHGIEDFIDRTQLTRSKRDQLERASFSIMLNIAEGAGRFTKPDKRHFYVIARGSTFECVAILDYLVERKKIEGNQFRLFYNQLEEISKMLFALIRSLEK